jgi:hypothetical protein
MEKMRKGLGGAYFGAIKQRANCSGKWLLIYAKRMKIRLPSKIFIYKYPS